MGVSAVGLDAAPARLTAKSILDYGAKPGGKALNTKAIQQAINEASRAGGGLVYVPPGTFLTGGLELKSHVTLYLEAGSVLLGSTELADYDYHEGLPRNRNDICGFHLIFARGAEDIAICGLGSMDGQGEAWWDPNPQYHLAPGEEWKEWAGGHYRAKYNNTRPSPMLEFVECRNLRISGVTLKGSPGWTLRPIACETVVIDGIRIRNPYYGVNTDGIDITASSNVIVSNCDIHTGDDGICLKSENQYGPGVPTTRNILITNCAITTSASAFKIGTATRGAFENIVFSNSSIYSPAGPMMNRVIGGVSIEMVDGGSMDGVLVSNIRMQNARAPIFVRLGARNKGAGSFMRNLRIEGIDAVGAILTSSITGVTNLRPSDITVSDCRIRSVEQGQAEWAHRDIPEVVDRYPEAWMMGRLPAYGFYVRHADRVRLRDVECVADAPDGRPAITCDDVDDVVCSGLALSGSTGDAPVFDLRNSRRVFLTGIRMPVRNSVMAHVRGESSEGIELVGNVIPTGREFQFSEGASQGCASAR